MAVSPSLKPASESRDMTAVWAAESVYNADANLEARDYSYANLSATALLPAGFGDAATIARVPLPTLTLVSISTHRDVYPVVASGQRGIRGYGVGHRVVAGTLGFNIAKENPFADLIRAYSSWQGNAYYSENILPDELPPFDLLLLFKDDKSGWKSGWMKYLIKGIKILDSSRQISVRDIMLTDTYSFMAMGITELIDMESVVVNSTPAVNGQAQSPPISLLDATIKTEDIVAYNPRPVQQNTNKAALALYATLLDLTELGL